MLGRFLVFGTHDSRERRPARPRGLRVSDAAGSDRFRPASGSLASANTHESDHAQDDQANDHPRDDTEGEQVQGVNLNAAKG